MSKVWRMTGPPEHWITTLVRKSWGLTETNRNIWEKLSPGDLVYFHSTRGSAIVNNAKSSIIGFGMIDNSIGKKNELWWLEEHRSGANKWKYLVPFKTMEFFSDTKSMNQEKYIDEKSHSVIQREIKLITQDGISITKLSKIAKEIDPDYPNFPVNGSASGFEEIYEDLILQLSGYEELQYEELVETHFAEIVDKTLPDDPNDLLNEAKKYTHEDRYDQKGKSKSSTRREYERQKRLIAKIEDYTCQVCEYRYEYENSDGQKRWIIDVDHIIPKSEGGTEEVQNLWVLCPNCHRKKTHGVITINIEEQKVLENGNEISITDNHLF